MNDWQWQTKRSFLRLTGQEDTEVWICLDELVAVQGFQGGGSRLTLHAGTNVLTIPVRQEPAEVMKLLREHKP